MEVETLFGFMDILIDVVDPVGVETGGAAFQTVHLISFGKKQLRQVGAVLACDACNKGARHKSSKQLHPAAYPPYSHGDVLTVSGLTRCAHSASTTSRITTAWSPTSSKILRTRHSTYAGAFSRMGAEVFPR